MKNTEFKEWGRLDCFSRHLMNWKRMKCLFIFSSHFALRFLFFLMFSCIIEDVGGEKFDCYDVFFFFFLLAMMLYALMNFESETREGTVFENENE